MRALDPKQWAQTTFGSCVLGDRRRTNRLVEYAAREAETRARSTSRACGGNAAAAEGAYRLMRNENVRPDAIAEGGFQATVEAARESALLLAIEDSTTIGFRHRVAEELGHLGGTASGKTRGFWVHTVLLVDAETEKTVGLVHQQRWIRDPATLRGRVWRKRTDSKESEKWQLASECVAARMGDLMSRVISVCDREADIHDYIAFKLEKGERFLVRSCKDRETDAGDSLWSEVRASQKLGTIVISVQQRGGDSPRAKRDVELTVRAQPVTLKAPKFHGPGVPSIEVWTVHALEEDPPKGIEPLEWLILTSENCASFEAARVALRYYSLRWRIEDFHKAWKSGCGVEERRMQTPDNLERIAVMLAFLAVRTLQLNEEVAKDPHRGCDAILSEDEWKCLWVASEKSPPPQKAPTTQWARTAIARLGGWLDTKRTGRVGWSTWAEGWLRLMDKVDGFQAAKTLFGSKM